MVKRSLADEGDCRQSRDSEEPMTSDTGTGGRDDWPDLNGLWEVERAGGLLPPLIGMRKRISGSVGETLIGPLVGATFDVVGFALRYRAPFRGFVDVLAPEGDGFAGRALFRAHEYGRFRMRRLP